MNAPYSGLPAYPAKYFQWSEVACRHCGGFPDKAVLQSLPFLMIAHVAFAIRVEIAVSYTHLTLPTNREV